MVGLAPLFEGDNKLYAYAIGVVAGTLVQLLMMLPALRRIGFPVGHIRLPKRGDVRVKRVLLLMLPVSVGLGLININLLLNSTIGSMVSDQVPRAIDAAFRIYMLPQGMFSVAVATVLFPQLARLAAREDYAGMQATIGVGLRQIALLLIPAGAAMLVLAEPMVRLVYQRGEFDAESTKLTAEALFWFALQPPVQRLRADAHARVLLAPAAVDADDARGRLAGDQRGRLLPAGRARSGSAASCSARRSPTSRSCSPRRSCCAARWAGSRRSETLDAIAQMLVGAAVARARSPTASGGRWTTCSGVSLLAQIISRRFRALAAGAAAYAGVVLALADPRGAADRRPFRPKPPAVARNLSVLWPTRQHIRNFSIIAHIDHGKSTLADRILELTHTVDPRAMRAQLLDSMDLERERGITIKAQAVRVFYTAQNGETYQLHLIDTPGHVDFTYEVSRSLAACEGALLVVDASQGVEAQTVANTYLAIDAGLELIPTMNKVDLPGAEPERVAGGDRRADRRGPRRGPPASRPRPARASTSCSSRSSSASRRRTATRTRSPRALIFDSEYDQYRGVIAYIRVVDGTFRRARRSSACRRARRPRSTTSASSRPPSCRPSSSRRARWAT